MSENRNTGEGSAPDLKSLRESRGLTIEALYNATKVRPAFLEAIETGNFRILPERIYSEAFIRNYAAQVGVNPEDILSRYRKYLNIPEPGKTPEKKTDKKTDKKAEKNAEGQAASRQDDGKSPLQEIKAPEHEKSEKPVAKSPAGMPGKKFSRLAVSLVMTVLVICGGFLYFLLSDDSSGPELLIKAEKPAAPAPQEAGPQAAPDMKPAETQPNEQPGANAGQPTQESQPVAAPESRPAAPSSNKLVIHANELTWISITEDNSQPYQIMLRPGDNLERTAGKFLLDVGNAGGIVVNFNGADLGVPGQSGQVVHLVLPREQASE